MKKPGAYDKYRNLICELTKEEVETDHNGFSVFIEKGLSAEKQNMIDLIILPYDAKKIGAYTFESCDTLVSILLPNGLTEINTCAFHECFSLSDICIPDSLTKIGCGAFYGCTSLTKKQSRKLPYFSV